jgi:nucleoside-diphosphate-sugar epimerase
MKIFLTGATGFIGSHFLNHALGQGHEVIALRRTNSQPRIPLNREPFWVDGNLDGDHRSSLDGVNVFVHLASHTPNPPYDTLDRCLYWNVFASLQLAKYAVEMGVKHFIVAGTCFEYGRTADKEENLDVNSPLEPTLSYPTSKAAASVAFLGLARELNLHMKLLRIFQVYGEGEDATRLWPSLRDAAISGKDFPMSYGEQVRDFISVTDVAQQLIQALDFNDSLPGQPHVAHLANGEPETLLSFAQRWWSHWGGKGSLLVGEMPYRKNETMRIASRKKHETHR